MTPLEITDYKSSWVYDASHTAYTFEWDACVEFCRANFETHKWASRKHMRPDDAHWFLFEDKADLDLFASKFDVVPCWNNTND